MEVGYLCENEPTVIIIVTLTVTDDPMLLMLVELG